MLAADHDVTLLGPEPVDVERTAERLGVDLSACEHRRVVDDVEATAASADFDVFVNGTYLSKAVNRAPAGWYYVHFPQVPAESTRRRRTASASPASRRSRSRPSSRIDSATCRPASTVESAAPSSSPTYQRYLANSEFTAAWVERLWGVPADVLYPPVRPEVAAG